MHCFRNADCYHSFFYGRVIENPIDGLFFFPSGAFLFIEQYLCNYVHTIDGYYLIYGEGWNRRIEHGFMQPRIQLVLGIWTSYVEISKQHLAQPSGRLFSCILLL